MATIYDILLDPHFQKPRTRLAAGDGVATRGVTASIAPNDRLGDMGSGANLSEISFRPKLPYQLSLGIDGMCVYWQAIWKHAVHIEPPVARGEIYLVGDEQMARVVSEID